MDVAGKLRELRAKSDRKQHDVAGDAGITRQRLSWFENGIASPTINQLGAVLRVYGVTLAEFFASTVPNIYANPHHHEIHRQLQGVLESRDTERAAWLCGNIEVFYEDMLRKKVVPSKKRRAM